jgi:hypothetical protein
MPAASRPAVTAEHQRAAFELMAWTGWTFEQAMADPLRSRLVKLCARQMCTDQARVMRRTVVPAIDTRPFQVYQTGQRVWVVQHQTDCKRAAAGDLDD